MKKIDYKPAQVRLFVALLTAFCALLVLKRAGTGVVRTHAAILAVAALVPAFFLAVPRPFFPVFKAILTVTGHVGHVVFTVISGLVFFLVLTPITAVMRLAGKTFMTAGPDPGRASYYEDGADPHEYERQF